MAIAGWAITASDGTQTYFIEGGLRTPAAVERRIKYWQKNEKLVLDAIDRAIALRRAEEARRG